MNDRVLLIVNRAAIGLIIEIMFLMTLKPRIPGILVSLLVTAALAAAACQPLLVRPSA